MIRLESGKTYIWQWDTKQRVILTDIDAGTEVHFSNCKSKTAPVVLSYADGDKIVANIPALLMQEALDITAYAYDSYNTKHCSFIGVIGRPKPDDYVYEEVEIVRYADLARKIPFDESYEGCLLYVVGGVAKPLKLGPGLSIRDGVLYVSGGTDEPEEPVGVVTAEVDGDGVFRVYLDGVEVAPVVDDAGSLTWPGLSVVVDEDGSMTLVKED